MPIRRAVVLLSTIVAAVLSPPPAPAGAGPAVPTGAGSIQLVDGATLDAHVLFKHPACDRLVVRSVGAGTVQSLTFSVVHKVTAAGRSVTLSPRRALTDAEEARHRTDRLWGDEAEAGRVGRYAAQKWPPRPVIVWAHPGTSGEFDQAANWLDEAGRPCVASPWRIDSDEENTPGSRRRKAGPQTGQFDGDVLLPAADAEYSVFQPGNRDHLGAFRLRHLTIERNAAYNVRYTVQGNLWMKDGSMIGRGTQTGGLGGGEAGWNTFARFCGRRWADGKSAQRKQPGGDGGSEWIAISHWVWIDTGEGGSLEVIGKSAGPGDRLTLQRGTLIVSTDSYIGNGNRGCYYGMPGTTTILLDGAGVGCRHRIISRGRATYGIAGTLLCGTPEHPLTRDLRIECCLYNIEDLEPAPRLGQRTSGASFVLGETGTMIVHSRDPKAARVVFCPVPDGNPVSQYVVAPRAKDRPTPTGITAVFAGQTRFDGVAFEGFCKGGIVVAPEARKAWKNASFGPNQAAPADLFVPLPAEGQ